MAIPLTPGTLLNLLEHPSDGHRPALLQVIGIVQNEDEEEPSFFLNLSDSSHSTYVSLCPQQNNLIHSETLQVGQLIQVSTLETDSNGVSRAIGLRPIPARYPCALGTPVTAKPHQDSSNNGTLQRSVSRAPDPQDHTAPDERPKRRMVKSRLYSSPARRSAIQNLNCNPNPHPSPRSSISAADWEIQPKPRKASPYREIAVPSRYRQASPVNSKSRHASLTVSKARQASPTVKVIRHGSPSSAKRPASAGRAAAVLASAKVGIAAAEVSAIAKRRSSSIYCAPNSTQRSVDLMTGSMKNMRKSSEKTIPGGVEKSISKIVKAVSIGTPVLASKKPGDTKGEKIEGSPQKTRVSISRSVHKTHSSWKNSELILSCASQGVGDSAVKYERKWTDGTISWTSLSSALATLGKEAMQRRDVACQVASQALQEASAAESLIRSVSMFAELRSLSMPEYPERTIERFLRLYNNVLLQAVATSEVIALASSSKRRTKADMQCLSSNKKKPSAEGKENWKQDLFEDKARSAAGWVQAALSTDLALISNQQLAKKELLAEIEFLTPNKEISKQSVESGASPWPSARKSLMPIAATASPERTSLFPSEKRKGSEPSPLRSRRNSMAPPTENTKNAAKVSDKFSRDDGMEETMARLGKQLKSEAEGWFLCYIGEAIDCGFQFSSCYTEVLSGMKKVNEWLNEVVIGVANKEEAGADSLTRESADRLRTKIYKFLMHHDRAQHQEEEATTTALVQIKD